MLKKGSPKNGEPPLIALALTTVSAQSWRMSRVIAPPITSWTTAVTLHLRFKSLSIPNTPG